MAERGRKAGVDFLFIGGPHHVFHVAPVAAALSRMAPDLTVTCHHADARTGAMIAGVAAAMDAPALAIVAWPVPRWGRLLARMLRRASAAKGAVLLALHRRIGRSLAVVTPERTSAVLRIGLRRDVPLIHFRHGAGDRAPASERRLKCFDLIVVPAEKDIDRAIAQGVPADRLRTCGYVKLDYMDRIPAAPMPAGRRPLVLYNPHFDPAVSSWPVAARIVEAFRAQDRYDLVMAPHIRVADDLTAAERAGWAALAIPGRITIDFDSDRLLDMGWLRAADVYLGDVSSQLYEFLGRPRPCAFVNAHGDDWPDDPRRAGWHLGEVIGPDDDPVAAIDRAIAAQPARAGAQAAAVRHAFGDWHGAAERGARHILDRIGRAR